jgi:hypothetical protein
MFSGPVSEKADDELFFVDTADGEQKKVPEAKVLSRKQKLAAKLLYCEGNIQLPTSAKPHIAKLPPTKEKGGISFVFNLTLAADTRHKEPKSIQESTTIVSTTETGEGDFWVEPIPEPQDEWIPAPHPLKVTDANVQTTRATLRRSDPQLPPPSSWPSLTWRPTIPRPRRTNRRSRKSS